MALLGTKRFWVPYSSDDRKRPSFSLHDLPWIPTGRFKQLLIREGRGHRAPGRNSQEKQACGRGAGPWVPTRDTHASLSRSADAETPSKWGTLRAQCPQACRAQTGWDQRVDDADPLTPSEDRPWAGHGLFEPLQSPPSGGTQFWGH